jgi:hypothetical protein
MFQTKVVEKIETYTVWRKIFFSFKIRAIYEIMWEEYGRAGQATDGSMANARYVLDN